MNFYSITNSYLIKSGSYFQYQLNRFILFICVIILFFILVVMLSIFYVLSYKGIVHYIGHKKNKAEMWAFIFSSLALLLIGGPSMSLLFEYSSQTEVGIIVKIIGSQWYWRFEVSNLIEEAVSIYMNPLEELSVGNSRFLEVENRLILPRGVLVQFNITSRDVIHSFALPTLGVKVDATSGLLTVVPLYTKKIGTHYGQCSEICGINHSFIPFCLEVTMFPSFLYWVMSL